MVSKNLQEDAGRLLASLNVGKIGGIAYDTAWAARPNMKGRPEFPGALRWLLHNQKWDGSWGAEVDYRHDRVLSTISALISLELNGNEKYRRRIESGLDYLWRNMDTMDKDPYETIGSELLIPSLVEEAEDLGLDVPGAPLTIRKKRERKLGLIPEEMIYTDDTTLAHSLEFLGDRVKKKDLERCISPNGSVGCSPSATMFLYTHLRDKRARAYLDRVSGHMRSGGFPSQMPFDNFEYSWVIYNLIKAGWRTLPGIGDLVGRLDDTWGKWGVAWGTEFPVCDSDTSAITFKVLRDMGHTPDPGIFEMYETDEGFKCWEFELNPSASANIHILEAIQDVPRMAFPRREAMIEKVLRFLQRNLVDGCRWDDKWHVSPYYTTGHAVLALSRLEPGMIERSIDWIQSNQNEDGGWGHFETSTVEETAYALQALLEYNQRVESLEPTQFIRGSHFLRSRMMEGLERLWISKGLYCPINVVLSAALSVLEQIRKNFPACDFVDHDTGVMDLGSIDATHWGGA